MVSLYINVCVNAGDGQQGLQYCVTYTHQTGIRDSEIVGVARVAVRYVQVKPGDIIYWNITITILIPYNFLMPNKLHACLV